jgi:hypothetical protein
VRHRHGDVLGRLTGGCWRRRTVGQGRLNKGKLGASSIGLLRCGCAYGLGQLPEVQGSGLTRLQGMLKNFHFYIFKYSHMEMATGTYPTGSGHPYRHPHPPLCTRRVTRTRTRVEKCSCTRTRAGKFYPTGNPYPTSYPRITCKYQTFTYKNKSFQASNKLQTNIHIMTSLQYI